MGYDAQGECIDFTPMGSQDQFAISKKKPPKTMIHVQVSAIAA